jgi:ribonuclease BN (tRNA processing enzyme)
MKIHLLGCGTPTSDAERFGSSYVVEVGGQYIMFDCGPSTTSKLVKAGLKPTWVDYLFFTHHHFDHDVDYPCFLLSRWNESIGKENDLQVFGPNLTEQLTHRLMDEKEGAFAHDWIARINHPLSLNAHTSRGGTLPRRPPVIHAKDVGPGKVFSGSNWEVSAAPAEHVQPWLDSLAYRLDTEEGSVVVTGDTAPCDSVIELAKDADVLISLCTYIQEDIAGTPEAEFMCGSETVAEMAQAAGAKKLVITHQAHPLDQPGETERALRDITRIYDGPVVWGKELMAFEA